MKKILYVNCDDAIFTITTCSIDSTEQRVWYRHKVITNEHHIFEIDIADNFIGCIFVKDSKDVIIKAYECDECSQADRVIDKLKDLDVIVAPTVNVLGPHPVQLDSSVRRTS